MIVHGEGNRPCPFMLIGEGPGYYEDRQGRPFVGQTGTELDVYLDGDLLPSRDQIFLTNLYRQYGGKDYEYTQADFERDEPFLIKEFREVQPELIITMGRPATRYLLGDVDLEDVHGLFWNIEFCYDCGKPFSANKTTDRRLLGVRGQTENKTSCKYSAPVEGQTTERSSGDVRSLYCADTSSADATRSHLQSCVVSKPDTSGARNPSRKHNSRISATSDSLQKRASADGCGNERAQTGPIQNKATILSNLSESGIAPTLAEEQGQLQRCETCDSFNTRKIIVAPHYHIAAGFHSPETSALVRYDWQQLIALFDGELKPRALYDDPHPNPVYIDVERPDQIVIAPDRPVAIDTEGSARAPWSLQFSQDPGLAFVIRACRPDLVAVFKRRLRESGVKIVYHSALHDLSVMRAMGIETNDLPFDDTAVMSYLLCVEPRGLKPLCVRHCNMRMQSYEDVLGDAQNRLAVDYFVALWDCEQADYEVAQQEEFDRINRTPLLDKEGQPKRDKQGHIKFRRTTVMPAIPKTPLHKAVERGMRSRTPWKLWNDWEDNQPHVRTRALERLGDCPEATLDHVERHEAVAYGGRDADGTGRLVGELKPRVEALDLENVYDLELGTYPLIDRMHTIGIKPDLPTFGELSRDLDFLLADLQIELEQQTGIEGFNANSGDQVAEYVFGHLGLEGIKKTESGRFSTNKKILEALEHEHPEYPVLTTIGDYREYYKLKNTFVDRIPYYTHRWPFDHRIHATFRTTTVITGRLSASDPNLLAQPKHGKFAKRFRRGWVAELGHLLGEWDLSQIELRVGASLSADEYMLKVYRGEIRNPDGTPIDLHAGLAQRIFGRAKKDQTSADRTSAKAINFGFWMGQTKYGLMVELRKNGVFVDEDDAQRWIDQANDTYKGAQRYKDAMIAEARRNGFIRCPLSGRLRYIGGIKARDEALRAEAERFAFSTPIQEGATAIAKRIQAAVWKEIIVPYNNRGDWVQPILWVHDALDMEFDQKLGAQLHPHVTAIMTRVPKGFLVPIETSGDYGPNLAEMVSF